jgi:hypothetical protein
MSVHVRLIRYIFMLLRFQNLTAPFPSLHYQGFLGQARLQLMLPTRNSKSSMVHCQVLSPRLWRSDAHNTRKNCRTMAKIMMLGLITPALKKMR